jgi:16S rRNA C967 or C1407 C5-methylase (RsmB/RsmF family)
MFTTADLINAHGKYRAQPSAAAALEEAAAAAVAAAVAVEARQYDRVLVDAECTHDGSVKHLARLDRCAVCPARLSLRAGFAWDAFWLEWPNQAPMGSGLLRVVVAHGRSGWDQLERRLLDETGLQPVLSLQRGLLRQGFRMLRPGGSLVYSTCSFSRAQNECIVEWLLEHEPAAQLEPIPNSDSIPCKSGFSPSALSVRFDPVHSGTGGFFMARIRKLGAHESNSDGHTVPAVPLAVSGDSESEGAASDFRPSDSELRRRVKVSS